MTESRGRPGPRSRAFVGWTLRWGKWLWAAALVLAVPATWRTAELYAHLRSEIEQLLPRSAPSVLAIDELRARLPGLQHLGVVVDTGTAANVPAAERFLDDLAERIRAYPPDARQVRPHRGGRRAQVHRGPRAALHGPRRSRDGARACRSASRLGGFARDRRAPRRGRAPAASRLRRHPEEVRRANARPGPPRRQPLRQQGAPHGAAPHRGQRVRDGPRPRPGAARSRQEGRRRAPRRAATRPGCASASRATWRSTSKRRARS